MFTGLFAAAAVLAFAATDAPASPDSNPVATFIHAADASDVAAMKAALDRRSSGFIRMVDGCYLRRVYLDKAANQILATWMCPVGADKSRVVIANVSPTADGKASIAVQMDTTNNRPAPPRTGSALD